MAEPQLLPRDRTTAEPARFSNFRRHALNVCVTAATCAACLAAYLLASAMWLDHQRVTALWVYVQQQEQARVAAQQGTPQTQSTEPAPTKR